MATEKNEFSSLSNLEELAAKYKTNLSQFVSTETPADYIVADISKEELENITTFVINSVVKDSVKLESEENTNSLIFSEYLRKYFEDGLTPKDILDLKVKVNEYNSGVSNYLYENIYDYIFEINSDSISSFFSRAVTDIKDKIKFFIDTFLSKNTSNKNIKKAPAEWFGRLDTEEEGEIVEDWYKDDDSDSELRSERLVTVEEFYNSYLLKSKLIEAIVLISAITYSNNNHTNLFGVSLSYSGGSINFSNMRGGSIIEDENFFNLAILPNDTTKPRLKFNETLNIVLEETNSIQLDPLTSKSKNIYSFELKDTTGEFKFYIPIYSNEITTSDEDVGQEVIIDLFNVISLDSIVNDTITYNELFKNLYNNLYGFLKNINYTTLDNSLEYTNVLSFFYRQDNLTSVTLSDRINELIKEVANLYYYKDFIYEIIDVNPEQEFKNKSTTQEYTDTQNGQQLTFLSTSGVTFDDADVPNAQFLFGDNVGIIEENRTTENLLSYTILYKELNPLYRDVMLVDIQEFIFARILQQNEAAIREDYTLAPVFFKTYYENVNSIFIVSDAFNKYKYFYGNIYNARISNESDIIGYYVGDNTPASAFTLNYGAQENERFEIEQFLDIYKTSRDYYYKVLLNKSFIQDQEYKLYEKLFIAFLAIERFLTSKIDNIHNLDYYNDRDIFNFLESYGLGVLNKFDFVTNLKNYKLSIVKNYNELIKKKGSKDVIEILLRIFDLGNVSIEIKKFLLVERTSSTSDLKTLTVSIIEDDILEVKNNGNTIILTDGPIVNKEERELVFDDLSELGATTNVSFYQGDIFVDPREYISSYFIQDYYFVLNSLVSGPTISIFSKNKGTFVGSIDLSLTFGGIFSSFELTPENYNLYYYTYTGGVVADNPLKQDDLEGFLELTIEDYILNPLSVATTQANYITIQNIDDVPHIVMVNALTPGATVLATTKLYKTGSISKTIFEALKDLKAVDYPTDNFSVAIRDGVTFLDVPASSLITNYASEVGDSGMIVIKSLKLSILRIDNVVNNTRTIDFTMVENSKISGDELLFVEVPYFSENGTREINNNLGGGTPYSEFLINDPYWSESDVPESLLLQNGLDAVETKYLSLTLRENIYKTYIISRYFSSVVDYLEEKFIIPQYGLFNNMLNNINIDTGDENFGVVKIRDFFNVIKILFKSLIRLYEQKTEVYKDIPMIEPANPQLGFYWFDVTTPGTTAGTLYTYDGTEWVVATTLPLSSTGLPVGAAWFNVEESRIYYVRKYYGINKSPTAFDRTIAKLNEILSGSLSVEERNKFFESVKRQGSPTGTEYTVKTFNPYEKVANKDITTNWVNFTAPAGGTPSNLNVFNLKNQVDLNNNFIFNKVGQELKQSAFSNIKTDYARKLFKSFRSSGEYMIDTLSGLEFVQFGNSGNSTDPNYKGGQEIWLKFLSSYYTTDYKINNTELFSSQLSSREIDRNEGYYQLIDKIVQFPIGVIDGLLTPYYKLDLNLNRAFIELSEIIFEDIFLTTDDTLYISPSQINEYISYLPFESPQTYFDGTNIDEKITEISGLLVRSIEGIQDIFNTSEFIEFSFSFEENESSTLRFVKTAVEIFLSYTTTLYKTEYKRIYKTPSESVPLGEDINHRLFSSKIDTFFYDEKLTVKKED
jgi:hypothetical protein